MNDCRPSDPKRRWYRFSLRTLLLAVLAFALLCSLGKWFGFHFFLRLFEHAILDCPYGAVVVPTVFALACGATAWALACRVDSSRRISVVSVTLAVFLMLAATMCAYSGWARYRVVYQLPDLFPPRTWPYPDQFVMKLYAWLEARDPAPPGSFDYHGKWPLVTFLFDAIIFTLACMAGTCLGLVIPRFFPQARRKRIAGSGDARHHATFRRRTRVVLGLALAVGAAWLLVKMEQTRRQWEDAAEWAERGASASYRDGKLVGLHFNVLTLSMRYFENEQFGDEDLVQLRELTDLEALGLTDTQVTNAGLVHLEKLTKLKSLHLGGTQITDAGLVHLRGLTNLHRLDLSRTQVADNGLWHLRGLSKLDVLLLNETQITDAGLVHVRELVNLRYVRLGGAQVTEEGIENMRQAMPNCEWVTDH